MRLCFATYLIAHYVHNVENRTEKSCVGAAHMLDARWVVQFHVHRGVAVCARLLLRAQGRCYAHKVTSAHARALSWHSRRRGTVWVRQEQGRYLDTVRIGALHARRGIAPVLRHCMRACLGAECALA